MIVSQTEENGSILAIKAVFFDIDGTFLTDTKTVQKSTAKALKQLKAQGIKVGLATGRGPAFARPYIEQYGLDFAVTYNGQYVLAGDQVIYAQSLDKASVLSIMTYAEKHRTDLSLGLETGLWGSGLINLGTQSSLQWLTAIFPKSWAKFLEGLFKSTVRWLRPQDYAKLRRVFTEPIYQAILVASKDRTSHVVSTFPDLTVTRSSAYSLDLISKGQSKLRGICRLADYFGWDLDDIMAFGDSENDKDMLANVGVGIAMGNAGQDVRDLARHTTSGNNQDGIAQALFHYGLIHLDELGGFVSADDNFNKVKDFHRVMDGQTVEVPRALSLQEVKHRAGFKIEELVELVYASSAGNQPAFEQAVAYLRTALEQAVTKVENKSLTTYPLVGQVDALVDLLYFTYGSFVLMGADPKPFFDRVHQANMAKVGEDGQVKRDPVTNKIIKPEGWEARFAPEKDIQIELNRQIQKALKKAQNQRS